MEVSPPCAAEEVELHLLRLRGTLSTWDVLLIFVLLLVCFNKRKKKKKIAQLSMLSRRITKEWIYIYSHTVSQ